MRRWRLALWIGEWKRGTDSTITVKQGIFKCSVLSFKCLADVLLSSQGLISLPCALGPWEGLRHKEV